MEIKGTEVFDELYSTFLKNEYRQIVLYGGSRSSKSWSLMQLALIETLQKPTKITVWRNEKTACRGTIMEDFKNILYSDPTIHNQYVENKASGSFYCKRNGSRVVFEGADNIGKVLGMTQDISMFNEVTEFSESVYLQITQRTSRTLFADYNPSKRFWFERMKRREDTIFLHSYYRKNAFCPPEIVKQLQSYEPWETGSYEVIGGDVMYKGKPVDPNNNWPPPNKKNIAEGTANTYMWMVYGLGLEAEKPNKIYRGWKMIEDRDYELLPYTKYYGLDFGSSNPTALVEVKFDGDKTFYLKEKIYKPSNEMNDGVAEAVKNRVESANSSLIVADSAKKALITLLKQEGLMVVGATKGPGSVNLGISLCQAFNIVYTKSSSNISDEYSLYSWEVDRYGKATDTPLNSNDHIMDAIRYAITYLYKFLNINVKV